MTITVETIRLARAFGSALQGELSRADFNRMLDLNKADEVGSGICHSHNFCDANMVMLAAFEEVLERNPLDGPDGHMSEADTDLWNDAWTIAKEADFYA